MMITRTLLITSAIAVAIIAAFFLLWRRQKDDQCTSLTNFSEALFHLAATFGIMTAGLWVLLQRDWAPKMSVELKTDVAVLDEGEPKAILVQVVIAMKNEGRVPQEFSKMAFVARSYDPSASKANKFGDLTKQDLDTFISDARFKVMPGETEYAYAELRVPCTESIAQIFVDIEEPKHWSWSSRPRMSYERKSIVRLRETCSGSPNVTK